MELIFHPDLDFFLAPDHGSGRINPVTHRGASVKDIIESFGVPHTEVGGIEVCNGPVPDSEPISCTPHKCCDIAEAAFDYIPGPGDRIRVRPPNPPVDVTRPTRLRPRALETLKFVADVNVGGLARLLRLLGLDTLYDNGFSDEAVARIAGQDGRVVLTRDTGLLKRRMVVYGRRVRSGKSEEQLKEVLEFFGMEKGPFEVFSRCPACNHRLAAVEKKEILHRLKPLTRRYYHQFYRCPGCGRIFWQGSHVKKMREKLQELLPEASGLWR